MEEEERKKKAKGKKKKKGAKHSASMAVTHNSGAAGRKMSIISTGSM